jgi:outer membrane protein OmpA-like peptidoglycan-associated protein
MSKKDDTYEMLDDTPENSKKSVILLLILLLLMIGGIPTYVHKQSANQVKTVAPVSQTVEKELPASSPPAAAQPSAPISLVINFEEATAIIKPDQLDKLQLFYQQVKDSKGTIQINGYTDNMGSSQEGLILSKQRAEAAAAALKSWGTGDKLKLVVDSFGEKNPVGNNSTALGRQQNRRVELKFTPSP